MTIGQPSRVRGWNLRLLLVTMVATTFYAQTSSNGNRIPSHPRELKYPELVYSPPKAATYRRALSNGMVAFLAEDHDFPLINVSLLVRTGSYLDPRGKEGLGAMMGSQLRAGGTTSMPADKFDEEVDFLAATMSSGVGETQGTANLNCLSKDIDKALELFVGMLKNPGFQQDRIDLYKNQTLQSMERRNDRTDNIQGREWGRLMRGDQHFSTVPITKSSLESITRQDLIDFHKKYYHPGAFILAVSGDFKTSEMISRLQKMFQGWPVLSTIVPPVPKPTFTPQPGVYVVNKNDVNQGRVAMGHLGTMRDNPDYYALNVMDDILGGGGFTSRITSRVRSDEGLAYSAGSNFGFGVYYDGVFQASFESKSPTCAQAAAIVLEEIERIRSQKVTAEELETSINSAVEIFPRYFATAGAIVGTFANDEYTKRKPDFWDTYRDRIRAVTADDVLRVAKKYLMPDKMVILAVGNVEEMLKGNPDKPEFTLKKFSKSGDIRRIPLPDPLTMVYPRN
jgi:zinc protease